MTDTKPDWEAFGKAVMENWQYHCDVDAAEKFEFAVKHNILREIPGGFDPKKHDDDVGCAEKGDPWYELNIHADLHIDLPAAAEAMAERLTIHEGMINYQWMVLATTPLREGETPTSRAMEREDCKRELERTSAALAKYNAVKEGK